MFSSVLKPVVFVFAALIIQAPLVLAAGPVESRAFREAKRIAQAVVEARLTEYGWIGQNGRSVPGAPKLGDQSGRAVPVAPLADQVTVAGRLKPTGQPALVGQAAHANLAMTTNRYQPSPGLALVRSVPFAPTTPSADADRLAQEIARQFDRVRSLDQALLPPGPPAESLQAAADRLYAEVVVLALQFENVNFAARTAYRERYLPSTALSLSIAAVTATLLTFSEKLAPGVSTLVDFTPTVAELRDWILAGVPVLALSLKAGHAALFNFIAAHGWEFEDQFLLMVRSKGIHLPFAFNHDEQLTLESIQSSFMKWECEESLLGESPF